MGSDHVEDDFQRIAEAARALGPIDPPPHLQAIIREKVKAASDAPAPPARGTWHWMGLAAGLALVTIGAYQAVSRLPLATSGDNSAAVARPSAETLDAMESRESLESMDALVHVLSAALGTVLEDLRVFGGPGTPTSSPTVSEQLTADLTVIDRAISESRTALGADPANGPARASLVDALRHKAGVLQSTLTLIGELTEADAVSAPDRQERHP